VPLGVALLWALPSFLLHNVIHEGAHCLVALAARCPNVSLWPFPGRKLGYWTWAHMNYETKGADYPTLRLIHAAPVAAELLWLVLVLPALFFVPVGWWTGFFMVEAVSPLVDLTTWFWGFWREPPNPYCDAESHRRDFGMTRRTGRLWSAALLPLYGLVLWGVVRVFLSGTMWS
jgi:hypothetical protein